MTVERQPNLFPQLRTVYCLGYRYQPSSEVLFYTQPTLRTPLTIEPLILDISSKDDSKKEKTKNTSAMIQRKLKIHTEFALSSTPQDAKTEMQFILNQVCFCFKFFPILGNKFSFFFSFFFLFLFQINTSTELEKQLQSVAIPVRSLRRRSVHVDMQAIDEESASADESGSSTSFLEPASIGDHAENAELPDAPQAAPLLSQSLPLGDQPTIPSPDSTTPSGRKPSIWLLMFMIITFCFRLYSEGVFWLVAVKVTLRKQWTLKDVSAAAVQAHLRLKQACSWPINYILVKQQWPTDLTKALAIEIKYFFLSYFFLSFFCSTLPDHSSFHTKPLQQHLAGGERCLAGDCAWRISLPEHPHLR